MSHIDACQHVLVPTFTMISGYHFAIEGKFSRDICNENFISQQQSFLGISKVSPNTSHMNRLDRNFPKSAQNCLRTFRRIALHTPKIGMGNLLNFRVETPSWELPSDSTFLKVTAPVEFLRGEDCFLYAYSLKCFVFTSFINYNIKV